MGIDVTSLAGFAWTDGYRLKVDPVPAVPIISYRRR